MGDLSAPAGHSSVDPVAGSPSVATGGGCEVRGSSARKLEGKLKRNIMSLEKWPPALPKREGMMEAKAKVAKTRDSPRKGYRDIRNWFEARGKPPENK